MSVSLALDIILFIGAAQGLLLSIVLFTLRRGQKTAHRILAVLLLVFALMIFFHTLADVQHQPPIKESHATPHEMVVLLFGPLFFLYARALTDSSFIPRLRDGLHFVPFALAFLFALILRELNSRPSPALDAILPWAVGTQLILYFLGMVRVLRSYEQRIRQDYSSLDLVNLRWLRFFTVVQLTVWPIAGIIEIAGGTSSDWNIVWLLISCFIYAIGYWGLRQPEIFGVSTGIVDEDSSKVSKKYGKSSLSQDDALTLKFQLGELMAEEKPYLNSNLTLPALSRQLNVSTHQLSQVINEREGVNFYEYINGFRVEEAKRLLGDREMRHLTIAALGFDAGFNSVSSFNAAFKKQTDMSPSQFRRLNAQAPTSSPTAD